MTTANLATTLPRGARVRIGSIAPSPACGGGSGRGLAQSGFRSALRESAVFPLPNLPPQAREGARGVAP
jgi:hypothetical protein